MVTIRNLLSVLALLGTACLLCPAVAQAATKPAATSCRLSLEGYNNEPGFKSADLDCDGAVLTAATQPELETAFGQASAGVKWSTTASCTKFLSNCLLAICASNVTFSRPVVQNILVPSSIGAVICVANDSTVTIQDGLFSNWHGQQEFPFALAVPSSSASLLISNTTFTRDRQSADAQTLFGGALLAFAGNTTIRSSTFSGNHAEEGAAITAKGDALVEIDPGFSAAQGKPCWPQALCSAHSPVGVFAKCLTDDS